MSIRGIVPISGQLPGINVPVSIVRTATAGLPPQNIDLAAAKTGTLSTRTNDTAGTLTMTNGHGIVDGDRIAIFWGAGVAYLATVGTVATNSVPFTGAAGTVLPIATTAVTVQVMTPLDVDFDGDKAEIVMASFTRRGVIVFEDASNTVLDAEALAAGEGYVYISGISQSNPLAGDPVDEVWIANGDSTTTSQFVFGGIYNSDE
jgi:hypothetical protein